MTEGEAALKCCKVMAVNETLYSSGARVVKKHVAEIELMAPIKGR
jgi:hypothetical protein